MGRMMNHKNGFMSLKPWILTIVTMNNKLKPILVSQLKEMCYEDNMQYIVTEIYNNVVKAAKDGRESYKEEVYYTHIDEALIRVKALFPDAVVEKLPPEPKKYPSIRVFWGPVRES